MPIGDRAIHWTEPSTSMTSDPAWALHPDEGVLFLSTLGEGLDVDWLTKIVKGYIEAADTGKTGACHALESFHGDCHVLDAGADIRALSKRSSGMPPWNRPRCTRG